MSAQKPADEGWASRLPAACADRRQRQPDWDWDAIEAVETDARQRIWDTRRTPRCQRCGRPMVAGQIGMHRVCR